MDELQRNVDKYEHGMKHVPATLHGMEKERDDMKKQRDDMKKDRDELQEKVSRLQEQLCGAGPIGGRVQMPESDMKRKHEYEDAPNKERARHEDMM